MLKKEIINEILKLFGTNERKQFKKDLINFYDKVTRQGFIPLSFGDKGFVQAIRDVEELRYRDQYNHDSFGDAYLCNQLMNEKALHKCYKMDLEGMLQKLQEK